MRKEHFEHIEAYIEQYDQNNTAPQYVPEKDYDNYVYIFGSCFGVVLIPENDGRITFAILSEDDEHYFIQDKIVNAHNFWISDLITCLNIAQEYVKQNATVEYFVNTDTPCGYQLPYKN